MPHSIDGHGRSEAECAYRGYGGGRSLVNTFIGGLDVEVIQHREVQHRTCGDPGVLLTTTAWLKEIQQILGGQWVARYIDGECAGHPDVGSATTRKGFGRETVDSVAIGHCLHRDGWRRHAAADNGLDDLPIDVQCDRHTGAGAGSYAVGVSKAVDVHVARRRDRGCDRYHNHGCVFQRGPGETIVQVAGDGRCHPDGSVRCLGTGAIQHVADLVG